MPFCNVKGHLLMCKRACFAMQKGVFYNPLCNLLILRRLQSRFFMIVSWFANNNTLPFVRVFQKPLPVPLRRERGDNKRDSPLCLRGRNEEKTSLSPALSEGRGRTISEIPRCIWECIKRCLRVFGSWFWRRKVNELRALNYELTN